MTERSPMPGVLARTDIEHNHLSAVRKPEGECPKCDLYRGIRHNHMTRDIKPSGVCPACDLHGDRWTRVLVAAMTDEERQFNCTCTVENGCDEDHDPPCGVCHELDPEWPCPAEQSDESTVQS